MTSKAVKEQTLTLEKIDLIDKKYSEPLGFIR